MIDLWHGYKVREPSPVEKKGIRALVTRFGPDVTRRALEAAIDENLEAISRVEIKAAELAKATTSKPAGPALARVEPGHPCHGHVAGDTWEEDDGTKHHIDPAGWWWRKRPGGNREKREKVA